MLNNREIASAIWLLAFVAWALRQPNIRKSLGRVVRSLLRGKLLASIILLIIYVVVLVRVLHTVGMWHIGFLKDTVVWFFIGAMAMVMRYLTIEDTSNVFRKIIADTIKVVILLEFLVNTYAFHLAVEILLVPIIAVIIISSELASMKEGTAILVKPIQVIQFMIGFFIIFFAVNRAIADWQNLQSLETIYRIALAPTLSFCMFPFLYIALVISQYETIYARMGFAVDTVPKLRQQARRRIMLHAGVSLKRLRNILQYHIIDLMHVKDEQDIERILATGRQCRNE